MMANMMVKSILRLDCLGYGVITSCKNKNVTSF